MGQGRRKKSKMHFSSRGKEKLAFSELFRIGFIRWVYKIFMFQKIGFIKWIIWF